MITELKPNQVFVFGSNLAGVHAGGAARQAFESFGAIMGVGVGKAWNTYAVPTLDGDFKQLRLEIIGHYLEEFAEYANLHPQLEFLLTKIGTGIAGFTEAEMESIIPNLPSNVIRV